MPVDALRGQASNSRENLDLTEAQILNDAGKNETRMRPEEGLPDTAEEFYEAAPTQTVANN